MEDHSHLPEEHQIPAALGAYIPMVYLAMDYVAMDYVAMAYISDGRYSHGLVWKTTRTLLRTIEFLQCWIWT